MIIGINGKIGSGKDTVGKIIQYLTLSTKHGPYIGFETFDDVTLDRNSKFEVKKFAGKVKTIASLLTGIPVENFEDQEFKKSILGVEWGTVQQIPLNSIPPFADIDFNVMMSVREFLQKLGTEAMRDGLHENVWVNALFADYRPQPNKAVAEFLAAEGLPQSMNAGEENYPNWIITDMRFPNEMKAVEERKGITVRVNRNNGTRAIDINPHPSETSLDDAEFNYTIENDGSIDDLIEKVRQILITEKII
jgi:ABC-type dipeptide/oligopeptide/nickel transport system ATPase component